MDDKISMLQVRIDVDCVDGKSYDNINVAWHRGNVMI